MGEYHDSWKVSHCYPSVAKLPSPSEVAGGGRREEGSAQGCKQILGFTLDKSRRKGREQQQLSRLQSIWERGGGRDQTPNCKYPKRRGEGGAAAWWMQQPR